MLFLVVVLKLAVCILYFRVNIVLYIKGNNFVTAKFLYLVTNIIIYILATYLYYKSHYSAIIFMQSYGF